MTGSPSRARRLSEGWSANLLQMALGIAQQVALVPIFLHYWSNDVLAAWLAIYAAGNLVLVVDAGLQVRAINRFLAFKSSVDSDRRTGQFYAELRRIYLGLGGDARCRHADPDSCVSAFRDAGLWRDRAI